MNDASSDTVAAAHRPADHPPVRSGRIGVLIANLGTPDATDYWSMRRYLKEFLSDKRVIEDNSLACKLVFNLIILTRRPAAKGHDYDTIWNRELNESPLKTITRSQAQKLAADLIKSAKHNRDKVKELIAREVSAQTKNMGVATQAEVDTLKKRVHELERATGLKPTARKPTAAKKRTAAKRTSAKKTTAAAPGSSSTA